MKPRINRRPFIEAMGLGAAALTINGRNNMFFTGDSAGRKPNFVTIFCDDLGYGAPHQ